ncbi:MAG TPA: histidinol dehydrogenase [Solirubrobacteraceae bacterium]|nr:histidinol dehydrogenase [Solirubrobacteraceae bacterium]
MRRSCTVADAAAVAAEVRGLVPAAASVAEEVAAIVEGVRLRGNAAVAEYERRFGGPEAFEGGPSGGGPFRVPPSRLSAALDALAPDVREGLEVAIANVSVVAAAGLDDEAEVTLDQGQTIRLRDIPVRRAALYAPGGRAPYPSSVVMGAVTARAAGVDEVAVAAPAHPVILAAAALCEADEVYAMGGAQAIAALAHGTESVPRVDVIVGPGNLYVQEAKRQVSGLVGIDGFAGPSDLCVILSAGADPEWATADLAAQAEHGRDSLVVAVSDDPVLLPDGVIAIEAADLDAALAFAEAFAPEHLQLMGHAAEALAPRVRSAGCLFVGQHAGTAFGDYVAGSNHTLPTGGAARFASGLNVRHFRRRMAEVRIPPGAAATLAPSGAAIARAEGFEAHAASMEARGENPAR